MFCSKVYCKLITLSIISFFIKIFISNIALAKDMLNININKDKNYFIENENEVNKQLSDYKSISKWIIANQSEFKKVLSETAKKSTTKWVIDKEIKNDKILKQSTEAKTPITDNNTQSYLYHIVKHKETLYSIAKMYNIKLKDIMKLNNLSEEEYIYIGQKLLISEGEELINTSPSYSTENAAFASSEFEYPKCKYYQVVEGDTIYSISRSVNLTPEDLIKFNNIEKVQIYPGMILKVPANYNKVANSKNVNKFEWPVIGRLLISFGPQKTGMLSEGINIMARKGTPVKSVADGVVIYVGSGVKALGNIILIQHQLGWVSVYGYLDSNMIVKKGQEVKASQVIGYVGKPNNVKISQLHFELRENVTPRDPLVYLNSYT